MTVRADFDGLRFPNPIHFGAKRLCNEAQWHALAIDVRRILAESENNIGLHPCRLDCLSLRAGVYAGSERLENAPQRNENGTVLLKWRIA